MSNATREHTMTGAKVERWVVRNKHGGEWTYTDEAGARKVRDRWALESPESGCSLHRLREVDPARDSAVAALVEAARELGEIRTKWCGNCDCTCESCGDLGIAMHKLSVATSAFPPSPPPSNSSPGMPPPVTAEDAAEPSPSPATTGGVEDAEAAYMLFSVQSCDTKSAFMRAVATLSAAHAEKVRELEGRLHQTNLTIAELTKERDQARADFKAAYEAKASLIDARNELAEDLRLLRIKASELERALQARQGEGSDIESCIKSARRFYEADDNDASLAWLIEAVAALASSGAKG
jgi:hypothetical protein